MNQSTFFDAAIDERSATFSPCRRYRYTLTRRWAEGPLMCWGLLNPSKADEHRNDPTVDRLTERARRWGYAGFVLWNAFAVRATDPKDMLTHPEPIGPDNDAAILAAVRSAPLVVVGWGAHGGHLKRSAAVLTILRESGVTPYCLARTKAGEPGHPLFLPYSLEPVALDGGPRS